MNALEDSGERRVLRIASAAANPLMVCREDRVLPGYEPIWWVSWGRR